MYADGPDGLVFITKRNSLIIKDLCTIQKLYIYLGHNQIINIMSITITTKLSDPKELFIYLEFIKSSIEQSKSE